MALLVAVLALLGAPGCGADRTGGVTGNPTSVVHAAPDRTTAAGSAKVDASMDVAAGRGLAGTGVVDFATARGDMRFQRTGLDARTQARYHLVVDGSTGYLAGTGVAVGPGRSWLGGSLPDVAEAVSHEVSPLDSLMVRPGAGLALAFLRGAVQVLPYGGQEVQGTSTLRYSFLVDLGLAADASGPADRPALEAAARFIGPLRFPGDVWLDSRGRVRRIQFATDPKAQSTTTEPSLFAKDGEYLSFIVIDFSAFGTPAHIQIPDTASVQVVTPARPVTPIAATIPKG